MRHRARGGGACGPRRAFASSTARAARARALGAALKSPRILLERSRDAGLCLFALALPFNLWATQAGLALAALALLGLWGICGVRPRWPVALAAPVALYLVAVVVSLLGSGEAPPDPGAALGFWTVASPFVLAAAIPDVRRLRTMLLLTGGMAILMGAYGVLQHHTGVDWFRIDAAIARPAPEAPGRFLAIGNFEAHTTYAFSLAFPAMVGLALAAEGVGGWRGGFVFTLGAAAVTAGILVSYVRSIWIGLAVGLGVLAAIRRGAALRIAVGLAVAGAIAIAAIPSLRARALSIVDPRYNAGRAYIWDRSWRMLVDHPVTGIGYGAFRDLQDAYFDPAAPAAQVPRTGAHSTYLHVAVETGLLGLVAFLWIWIRVLGRACSVHRGLAPERRLERALVAGSMAGVACFLVGSFFQESFFDGEVAFMLWFAVATMFVIEREANEPAEVKALDTSRGID